MTTRTEMINAFYEQVDENSRLVKSRQGQLEYATTMHYIHRFAGKGSKVLEIGAGTGRYSVALAKEGMEVTAVELADKNLELLRRNGEGLINLHAFQGDATNLSAFADESFDVTLSFGPFYHLYQPEEIARAIDEAVRVTKKGGVILCAFLSVYAIMFADYLYGNWAFGLRENFTEDYRVKHFQEQLFTGYDIAEFEALFEEKPVCRLLTAGMDGMLEPLERRPDFEIKDEDFPSFADWYLSVCEKRELLGSTNHLLLVCRKND